jgi:cobalt-zinc-cadmium efflux system outer membrane protein
MLAAGCAVPQTLPGPGPGPGPLGHPGHDPIPPPPPALHPYDPSALEIGPPPAPPELAGPRPVEAFIRVAMERNRGVQAAWFDVQAARERIPQATALDDPMVVSTIWPFPSNAPQFSLMGYGPYEAMISQEFPWFGTLAIRGEVAGEEVRGALSGLAAAQLDVIERVKRAYANLSYNERAERILLENRGLLEDFVEIATIRYRAGATSQQDVLRAENAVVEVDAELAEVRRGKAEARAALARQLHLGPGVELRTLPDPPPPAEAARQVEALYRIAAEARPELLGQRAEVSRSAREIELARKKYYPDVTVGLGYMMMSRANAMSELADGRDNVGLVVGFNLPIYREKLNAGVREAEARTIAEARRLEDLRDETFEAVAERFAEVEARREILGLFRDSYLGRSQQALDVAISDYQGGSLDFVSLITAWRDVLRVELQIAGVEAELIRALASLERVVGVQLREVGPEESPGEYRPGHPPDEIPGPPAGAVGSPFAVEYGPGGDHGEGEEMGLGGRYGGDPGPDPRLE